MYLHFLHLERIKLLLDPLSECGGEPTPRRWLAPTVVHARRESVIHTQVVGKRQSLRWRRSGAVGESGGRVENRTQHWCTRVEVRVVEERSFCRRPRSFVLLKGKRWEERWGAE